MFMTTTTYFISATIWSEQEFVESTVNPGIFASLTSGRLAILKDTAICVNMWLADSLIVCLISSTFGQMSSCIWAGLPSFHHLG